MYTDYTVYLQTSNSVQKQLWMKYLNQASKITDVIERFPKILVMTAESAIGIAVTKSLLLKGANIRIFVDKRVHERMKLFSTMVDVVEGSFAEGTVWNGYELNVFQKVILKLLLKGCRKYFSFPR